VLIVLNERSIQASQFIAVRYQGTLGSKDVETFVLSHIPVAGVNYPGWPH